MRPAPAREELRVTAAVAAVATTAALAVLTWTLVTLRDVWNDDSCDGPCHEMVILKLAMPVAVLLAAGLVTVAVAALVAVLRRVPSAGRTMLVAGVAFLVGAVTAVPLEPWVTAALLATGGALLAFGVRPLMQDWA